MPLYLVTDTKAPADAEARTLVDATSQAAAQKRVSGDRYTVETMKSASDAMALQSSGVPYLPPIAATGDDGGGEEGED